MNFRPTFWKIINGLLISLAIIFLGTQITICKGLINCFIKAATESYIIWLPALILFYIIVSFFQKTPLI